MKDMSLKREELRLEREKNDETIITFVSTINLRYPEIFNTIK